MNNEHPDFKDYGEAMEFRKAIDISPDKAEAMRRRFAEERDKKLDEETEYSYKYPEIVSFAFPLTGWRGLITRLAPSLTMDLIDTPDVFNRGDYVAFATGDHQIFTSKGVYHKIDSLSGSGWANNCTSFILPSYPVRLLVYEREGRKRSDKTR